MRALVEIAAFVGLSVGAHVMVLQSPGGAGPDGVGGAAGAETITLAALPGDLAARVADWTRPPEAQTRAPLQPPATPEAAPEAAPEAPARPALLHPPAPALASPPPGPLPPPLAEAPPQIDAAPVLPPKPPAPARTAAPKPAAKPAAAAPRAAQTARGTGKADSAGQSAKPSAAPTGKAGNPQLLAQWGGQIRASVERNKRYPAGTRATGKVTLRLSVGTDGRLQGVGIAVSAGDAALDRAALAAVQRARFPKAPKGIAPGAHQFNLPITFSR